MLDNLKSLGYKFSTRAALTVSVADIIVPESKKTILAEAENQVHRIEREFRRGRLSENERYTCRSSRSGNRPPTTLPSRLWNPWIAINPINMMADSGARGSVNQIRQLAGMRGLMASPSGKDHRAAHQGKLPRRPERAGVLPVFPWFP